MNNFDVAGILRTYAEKARNARDEKHLKEIIKDLRKEIDLRKINMG